MAPLNLSNLTPITISASGNHVVITSPATPSSEADCWSVDKKCDLSFLLYDSGHI
jgi:hypothetical protein